MPTSPRNYPLQGEEKERYLLQLDQALTTIVRNLPLVEDKTKTPAVQRFAQEQQWDLTRLPSEHTTAQTFSTLVERIRQEYRWFSDSINQKNPLQNRSYFQTIDIDASSGLPWQHDFIKLHLLKKEASTLLKKIPNYSSLFEQWENMLLWDTEEIEDVADKSLALSHQALQQNFLTQLEQAQLLSWEQTEYSLPPLAQKKIFLGGEELWSISFIRYSLASGMFQIYDLDLWQDIREAPQITQTNELNTSKKNHGRISQELERTLKFGEDNPAWYILQTIDKNFKSLHPVHVSRLLIGPFETKYRTNTNDIEHLAVAKDILHQDPQSGILRASWQYAYAPNHRIDPETQEIQQIIYREDWRQELLVSPSHYAGKVSNAIAGTDVHIWPY